MARRGRSRAGLRPAAFRSAMELERLTGLPKVRFDALETDSLSFKPDPRLDCKRFKRPLKSGRWFQARDNPEHKRLAVEIEPFRLAPLPDQRSPRSRPSWQGIGLDQALCERDLVPLRPRPSCARGSGRATISRRRSKKERQSAAPGRPGHAVRQRVGRRPIGPWEGAQAVPRSRRRGPGRRWRKVAAPAARCPKRDVSGVGQCPARGILLGPKECRLGGAFEIGWLQRLQVQPPTARTDGRKQTAGPRGDQR